MLQKPAPPSEKPFAGPRGVTETPIWKPGYFGSSGIRNDE